MFTSASASVPPRLFTTDTVPRGTSHIVEAVVELGVEQGPVEDRVLLGPPNDTMGSDDPSGRV